MSVDLDLDRHSLPRGHFDIAEPTSGELTVEVLTLEAGFGFSMHSHPEDQLSWMRSGAMTVTADGSTKWLRRDHLAWIPGQVPHDMTIVETGEVVTLYTAPTLRPHGERWSRAQAVTTGELLTAALTQLADARTTPRRRTLCHQLVLDLLNDTEPSPVLSTPTDPRAHAIAVALATDPADPRDLADFASELGVSEKTLSRAFLAGTGSTFRTWRSHLRLHTAAGLLVRGEPVARTARSVGYRTASSFIASFTEHFGITPGRYAHKGHIPDHIPEQFLNTSKKITV